MTGARELIGSESSLTFKLPANFAAKKITAVRITLGPMDTYKVEFLHGRGLKLTSVSEHGNVYAEDLRRLFTSETGLDLAVPKIFRKGSTI